MNDIAVIVPAFNAGRTLHATLDSIKAQTLPPARIIVVDDGSTDEGTVLAAEVEGVELLRQPNLGVAAAMNAGLQAACCEFVAFLDADDTWVASALESNMRVLSLQPELGAVLGWVEEFVCPSMAAGDAARFSPRPPQPGWLAGATLLRRTAFARVGAFNPDLRIGAWIDWVDRARRAGLGFGVQDALVLRRRLHVGSLSTSATARRGGLIDVARLALARRRQS